MSKKSTRVDLACQALRQAIIEQALPPGTKLPEDELGVRFGMSRTLVREVLAQLQSEGLVDAPPRRTATTAKPTLDQAREIFEIRRTAGARGGASRDRALATAIRRRPRRPCARRGSRASGRRGARCRSGWPANSTPGSARWRATRCCGATRRSGVALLADSGALRPAAFGRLRRQRTPRNRRRVARRQCRCRHRDHGPSSRLGRSSGRCSTRAARPVSISAPCCRAMPAVSIAPARPRSPGLPDRKPRGKDDSENDDSTDDDFLAAALAVLLHSTLPITAAAMPRTKTEYCR